VEQTVGPNSLVNSYDSARAVTWYRILPGGGKSFYTSLGHAVGNYTSDTSFFRLLSNAVLWACDSATGITEPNAEETLGVYPNPVRHLCTIYVTRGTISEIEIYNTVGKKIFRQLETNSRKQIVIDVSNFESGIYFVKIRDGKNLRHTRFIKIQ
jgi:hypothetical protein